MGTPIRQMHPRISIVNVRTDSPPVFLSLCRNAAPHGPWEKK